MRRASDKTDCVACDTEKVAYRCKDCLQDLSSNDSESYSEVLDKRLNKHSVRRLMNSIPKIVVR